MRSEDDEEGQVSDEQMEEQKEVKKKKFRGVSDIIDYTIKEKIGEGTFGQVLVGISARDKDSVALKRIILHNDQEGMPVTSIREIQLLKRCNHHNIISLKEMAFSKGDKKEKSRGQMYMVFPYMDHDLAGLLENHLVKLDPKVIKSYTKQMFCGLEYLHHVILNQITARRI
jgi:serine/threonine-protein kinase BUR1